MHYSALQRSQRGWRGLFKGEYVWFQDEETEQGRSATEVVGVGEGPLMCEASVVDSPFFDVNGENDDNDSVMLESVEILPQQQEA